MLKRNIIYHCTTAKGRGTITVKSISSLEAPTTIPIDVTAAGTSGKPATRSPYAVLRSANTVAGSCASNLLPNQLVAGGCGTPLCACSALLYPSPDKDPALVSESEEDKSIVYFLFALKVTNSENVLLQHVSRSLFEELIGDHISRHAVAAKLCEDVTAHVQGSPSGKLLAHTFLSAEESGKLKWFNEESKDLTQFYSRAPSLRMLYVMWSIVESTSPAPRPPTRAEIVDVQDRMVAANAPINLCDLASLYIFGFVDKSLIRFIATDMLREFKKTMDALGGAPLSVSSGVQCMLTLLLLWSYAEAVLRVDVLETPPVELLNGASEISRIIHSHIESRQKSRTAVTSKRQDVLYQLLGQITQKLETNVYELAAHCDVPAESDILADLSTWLLIQSPLSESSKNISSVWCRGGRTRPAWL
ncbi:hypothetical protein ADEAN_000080400 [Angomonas deanei]|uniref:Uncharacterized protein n=1 Tax=Angomonas deanei TaxID=59799 RepID=A0A7G2C3Q3_9TRYP|nr:hypothetical protein ADEAN_000080400 [Angomonas deanei]